MTKFKRFLAPMLNRFRAILPEPLRTRLGVIAIRWFVADEKYTVMHLVKQDDSNSHMAD